MKPQFVIHNNATSAVSLNELTIRYWYTVDGEKPQSFFCDYAQLGGSQISGSIVKLPAPVPGADHYLELKFGTGAGLIPIGGTSGEYIPGCTKQTGPITAKGMIIPLTRCRPLLPIGPR